MATSRANIPPVNLKDRIAALQQRNASPPQPGSEAAALGTPAGPGRIAMPGASSLRDKIANFERKGAVPVPRGRFGESAPATSDAPLKKRGELYGNRVPELAKSTGEAALLVRKRTVSSHTARSYSISKPLVPTLTGSSPPLPPLQPQRTGDWAGFSEARLPSTFERVERRAASDVLPRAPTTFTDVEFEEPLVESKDEENVGGKEEAQGLAQIVEPEVVVSPTPASLSEAPTAQESIAVKDATTSVNGEIASKASVDVGEDFTVQPTQGEPLAPRDDERVETTVVLPIAEHVSPSVEGDAKDDVTPSSSSETIQDLVDSSTTQTIMLESASAQPSSEAHDDVSPPPSAPLSLNTVTSGFSEETSAASEELHTPSDNMSFQTAESLADTKGVDENPVVDVQDAVVVTEPPSTATAAIARTVVVPAVKRTDSLPQADSVPLVKIDSPVDRPSDLPETPQTAKPKPAAIVSPPQSVFIPAATPSSPSEKAMLEYKAGQKSFHAVVHRKVVESSPVESTVTNHVTTTRPAQKKANPSFPPQKSTLQRVVSQAYVEPDSPSIGDLAALVADAALLEEALADPTKKQAKAPVSDVRQSRSLDRPRPTEIRVEGVNGNAISPPEDSPYSDHKTAANSTSFFTSNLRATPSVPSVPRKSTSTSPSRQSRAPSSFTSLRTRQQSMPGAYPRNSVCSEMSTDDSTMVSTPPSPPTHSVESSDASSIRSSTKSWKSSKKGLGRAGSWLFRKKEERPLPPLPEPTSPTPSMLLSPNVAAHPRERSSPLPSRPESWLSVSTTGSGDLLNSDFFDAFPSVPGSLPTPPSQSQTLPLGQKSSGVLPRSHTISGRPTGR